MAKEKELPKEEKPVDGVVEKKEPVVEAQKAKVIVKRKGVAGGVR